MISCYDIFRKDRLGQPIWVEAVESMEKGKLRIIELGARTPGQYMVFCQKTGQVVGTMTMVASPVARGEHRNRDGCFNDSLAPLGCRTDTVI